MNKIFKYIVFLFPLGLAGQVAPDVLWTQTNGGEYPDEFTQVQQTSDGGFVSVGFSDSYDYPTRSIWLHKVDEYGNEEWSKYYSSSTNSHADGLDQTNDGGFIIVGTGHEGDENYNDIFLLKIDSSGEEEWRHYFLA